MAIVINKKSPGAAASAKPAATRPKSDTPRFGKAVKPVEITFFTSQLALMLEIGTSLTEALGAVADQTQNPTFKKVIRSMLADIQEGSQLSDAMGRHPKIFNNIYISMVRAGETGGFLKKILDSMVEMQEKRQALIAQIRTTMTYPMVLCAMAIVVVIFILVGILPKFTVLFEGKESLLPSSTRFLMALSASVKGFWWAYIIGVAGTIVGIKFWKKSELGQSIIDWFLVSMPLISKIANKIYTAQLLRTLGHLMESQVPLIEALKVTQATFSNRYYKKFLNKIRVHVEQGGRFSRQFANNPYVMESVKQMVATGEEVGSLPAVMLRLAKFYDTEIEQGLKSIASMLEPAALIIMGVVVGLIVSSVILPIFKIAHTLH